MYRASDGKSIQKSKGKNLVWDNPARNKQDRNKSLRIGNRFPRAWKVNLEQVPWQPDITNDPGRSEWFKTD